MIEDARLIQSALKVEFTACKPILINADRDKIGDVIANLLSDAFKYSENEKKMEVKCDIIGNMA